MIRSYNGVRLLSSYLIRDSCKSIYKGVFHRTLDSGVTTLSRVLRGEGEVINPNNRVLSNASVRGSASLSTQDYETYQFYSDDDQFYTGEAEDDFPFIMDEEFKIDAGDADADDDDDDDDPPIDEEGNKEYWPVVGVITWGNLLLIKDGDFHIKDMPHTDIPKSVRKYISDARKYIGDARKQRCGIDNVDSRLPDIERDT